ncbi:MAG: hypothetical protein WAU78_01370 [Roseiarcus sp.]
MLGCNFFSFRNFDINLSSLRSNDRPFGNASTIRDIKLISPLNHTLLLKNLANYLAIGGWDETKRLP